MKFSPGQPKPLFKLMTSAITPSQNAVGFFVSCGPLGHPSTGLPGHARQVNASRLSCYSTSKLSLCKRNPSQS